MTSRSLNSQPHDNNGQSKRGHCRRRSLSQHSSSNPIGTSPAQQRSDLASSMCLAQQPEHVVSLNSSEEQGDRLIRQRLFGQSATAWTLASPLPRSRTSRAIERFFLDWIMYPCSTETVCPGYLHLTPAMYHNKYSGPLLRSAVEALAFANVRGAQDANGLSFETKSRVRYGAAVHQLRRVVGSAAAPNSLARDDVIASILLLDNWELMYANRPGIGSSHGGILFHILTLRHDLPTSVGVSFSVWRVASYRILCQLVLAEDETKLQHLHSSLGSKTNSVYAHMVTDAFRIAELRREMRRYIAPNTLQDGGLPTAKADESDFARLVQRVRDYVGTVMLWMSQLPEVWTPQRRDLCTIYSTSEGCATLQQRLDLPTQSVLVFHGLWIACMWASHWACLMLLHDCLAEMLRCGATSGLCNDQKANASDTQQEERSVRQLGSDILKAVPYLLGHTRSDPHSGQRSCESGGMLARMFALFPLSIVEVSSSATSRQRSTAANIKKWLQEEHQVS